MNGNNGNFEELNLQDMLDDMSEDDFELELFSEEMEDRYNATTVSSGTSYFCYGSCVSSYACIC